MPYSVEYDKDADCILVSVEGELDFLLFGRMAEDVAQCIKDHHCERILNDLREVRLKESVADIYSMPQQALKSGVARAVKRALVVSGPLSEFRFLETVFVNRGNIVKLFHNIDEARHWLAGGKAET